PVTIWRWILCEKTDWILPAGYSKPTLQKENDKQEILIPAFFILDLYIHPLSNPISFYSCSNCIYPLKIAHGKAIPFYALWAVASLYAVDCAGEASTRGSGGGQIKL
ncbi:hypothetical protein LZ318_00895, partial [Saccharopolyspora indica]|uniref:hypothetical protein n=1 Tax=Saccharopolyspora indica TaxID=1229659 RepID=UPI002FE67D36